MIWGMEGSCWDGEMILGSMPKASDGLKPPINGLLVQVFR